MDTDIEIRSAQTGDIDALIPLYHHNLSAKTPNNPIDDNVRAHWQSILDDPRLHYFVAEIDGDLVATCNLTVVPNLTHDFQPWGIVENVVTHVDYRRQGIGRRMIDAALDKAWREGCYKVMLMSGATREDAHEFYRALGFDGENKKGFVAYRPANFE